MNTPLKIEDDFHYVDCYVMKRKRTNGGFVFDVVLEDLSNGQTVRVTAKDRESAHNLRRVIQELTL